MSKIDDSTYKSIKKADKQNKKYSKGMYGHSRYYRNSRIFMSVLILLLIIADVAFSVIVFHTRKTVFVIVGCVLAIPFARNFIDLIMSFKAKPLSKEEYSHLKTLSDNISRPFLYDITITDTDGVVYIPCLTVYNNNIIAYVPDSKDTKEREKIRSFIAPVNDEGTNYRIFVTEKEGTFEKEIKKLRDADAETVLEDKKIIERLLSMGF